MTRLPGAVLFACNFNRVRSPMAEALLKRLVGDRVFVDSCGVRGDEDLQGPDPFVVTVMAELGCDLEDHSPKLFADLEDDSYDLIIALTDEAQAEAAELSRAHATEVEHWPTGDPTTVTGARDAILDAYRQVRDELAERIAQRFALASTGEG